MKRKTGFSLIEMMVVLVVGLIAMGGIMTMLKGFQRGQASVAQSIDFDNLVTLTKMVLTDPVKCAAAMQTISGSALALPAAITSATPALPETPVGQIVIDSFKLIPGTVYSGLNITSLALSQVTSGIPTFGALTPYVVNLTIRATKPAAGGETAVGGGNLVRSIPLLVTIQIPSGGGIAQLISCSTSAGAASGGASPPVTVTAPLTAIGGASGDCHSFLEKVAGIYGAANGIFPPPKKVYTATAMCPTGKKALAGGAQCGSGFSSTYAWIPGIAGASPGSIIGSQPTADGGGWSVACCVEGNSPSNTQAYVVCE